MALDWNRIVVSDDENNSEELDNPVMVVASSSGHSILWDKIVILDEESEVDGEEETIMLFASGIPGQAASIDEVTAESLPAGSNPTVENHGNSINARFHFGIPKGEKGDQGDKGDKGDQGDPGINGADSAVVEGKNLIITPASEQRYADIIHTSASGSLVHITDGAPLPVDSLTVDIDPVQDLHGYDAPWPAGGGKNLLNWTNTTQTINGVKFTVNSDGTVTANGTADGGDASFYSASPNPVSFPEGSYKLSGCPSGGSNSTYMVNETVYSANDTGSGANLTIPQNPNDIKVRIVVRNGVTVNNLLFKPMICLATASNPTTFEPYSNVCPISGHTSAVVTRTGVNHAVLTGHTNGTAAVDITVTETGAEKTMVAVTTTDRNYRYAWFEMSPNGLVGKTIIVSGKQTVSNGAVKGIKIVSVTDGTETNLSSSSNDDIFVLSAVVPECDAIRVTFPVVGSTGSAGAKKTISNVSCSLEHASVTISLGDTRYGGTLDVLTGKMTVDKGFVTVNGTENITWYINSGATLQTVYTSTTLLPDVKTTGGYQQEALCNEFDIILNSSQRAIGKAYVDNGYFNMVFAPNTFSTSDDVKTWLASNPLQLVYELATPLTVTLSPATMSLLLGENNIWSLTGSTAVGYRADTKLYIDGKIAELLALIS